MLTISTGRRSSPTTACVDRPFRCKRDDPYLFNAKVGRTTAASRRRFHPGRSWISYTKYALPVAGITSFDELAILPGSSHRHHHRRAGDPRQRQPYQRDGEPVGSWRIAPVDRRPAAGDGGVAMNLPISGAGHGCDVVIVVESRRRCIPATRSIPPRHHLPADGLPDTQGY